jgi:1-acyl-sn-glycerol-3-phosphate acyltransferase
MPVKYRIHFGDPIYFEGDPNDDDAVMEEKVEAVKEAITGLLEKGRLERRGIFT